MEKNSTFKCIDCKKEFEYNGSSVMPSFFHPTICDACSKLRIEEEKRKLEQVRLENLQEEIALLPFQDWDCSIGNNSLRNTIGRTVFEDGKLNNKSLWIKGDVGCGKTRSVSFVASTVIERGGHVRYEHCRKMLSRYSNEFTNGNAENYIEGLGSDRRILILDDYGVGKITERGAELLYTIADDRLIKKLPTWITSNLYPNEIADWFPESKNLQEYAKRIIRRITETFTIIEDKEK